MAATTKKSTDQVLKFDTVEKTEQCVWDMRLADLPRSEDRLVLNRTYNGDTPFDRRTAEENNIEVNRNFLEGTGNLTDARTQWIGAFLHPGDWYTVRLDSGPAWKRKEWGTTITTHLNRALKRSLCMISQVRETGAGVLLHGIGPTAWADRRSPIPKVLPISSLMIPSETDIDFENLEYFAVFREMTPAQLYAKTHGPKVDPGWNLPLVMSELKYAAEQTQKQPNATAFQFMPERVEELIKQDKGFWGSDAVPTVDYWDFYFREYENGTGWYRRIFLDWSSSGRSVDLNSKRAAASPNRVANETESKWLYTSGKRQYANSWQEIIHCNFGDCSCVAPFKYHSVRSLGWMIWGIVDIQNRLDCKLTEQAFSDLMWFFRVANQNDFNRIKKANFMHMGVIPPGVDFVQGGQRFEPNPAFIELVIQRNRDLITRHSAAYTRGNQQVRGEKEKTATQVMAEENSVNTLVSGVVSMAGTYENFKAREICRRLCIKNNPDPIARKFRKGCLDDGVPPEYLNVERWDVECEPAMGAGNKTVQMAIVQYLNQVRANLGPEAQRKVDHTGILITTGNAQIAEDLAPVKGQEPISRSAHDAELATDRLMRGLPLTPTPQMVYEDYIKVWLRDMTAIVQQVQQSGGVGTREQILGLGNMAQHVGAFLQLMGKSKDEAPKVRQYEQALGQITNLLKGFAQRFQQQSAAGNGQGGGVDAKDRAKIAATVLTAQTKAKLAQQSHAQRTAQRQVSFEMKEQQEERRHRADLRREQQEHQAELRRDAQGHAMDVAGEMAKSRLRSVQE
jgi:hypothetical protein